jgi:hypothetical protein
MPESNIKKLKPEMNIYFVYRPIFAHKYARNISEKSSEISAPLDRVLIVPARPNKKKSVDRALDSREYRKAYADIIAIMVHIGPAAPTAPPLK